MAFLKRLGFYLAGLSIGLVFLAFFFKKKSEETGVEFCYFPNCRTLKDMRSKPLSYADSLNTLIATNALDTVALKQLFLDGEVNFGESDAQAKPCKFYLIEGEIHQKPVTLEVENCDEKVVVLRLR